MTRKARNMEPMGISIVTETATALKMYGAISFSRNQSGPMLKKTIAQNIVPIRFVKKKKASVAEAAYFLSFIARATPQDVTATT